MSVIAWDGYSIAADKAVTNFDCRATSTKIKQLNDGRILAWVGWESTAQPMIKWYEDGADPARFPDSQKDNEKWTRLIVVTNGGVIIYEQHPFAITLEEPYFAWGSGRDFALGAMAAGATARQAVEIACRYNIYCGMGIDEFTLRERKK